MFIRRISLLSGALLISAAPVVAQDHAAHNTQDKLMKGSSIAIEGCVTAGENKDTFVLNAVREIPGRPVETGLTRVYWLDSISQIRGMAGQIVRVEGRIDGIQEGRMEVKPGQAADGGTIVELEGPGRDIDATPATVGTAGGMGTAPAAGPKKLTTVIKIDVDKVTAVRACGT